MTISKRAVPEESSSVSCHSVLYIPLPSSRPPQSRPARRRRGTCNRLTVPKFLGPHEATHARLRMHTPALRAACAACAADVVNVRPPLSMFSSPPQQLVNPFRVQRWGSQFTFNGLLQSASWDAGSIQIRPKASTFSRPRRSSSFAAAATVVHYN